MVFISVPQKKKIEMQRDGNTSVMHCQVACEQQLPSMIGLHQLMLGALAITILKEGLVKVHA